jgi:hypothetical protein
VDSDTGKTVKATLKLQIDSGDAKREAAATKKELDAITKAATLSGWRMGNRVERNKMHAEERKMMQEERQFWKERDKQEYDYTMAKRRSLAYMVQQGKIARRQEENEAKRAAREQERAMGSLPMQSLAFMGAGGFANTYGRIQTYGRLASAAGFKGAGGAIEGAAGPLAAAYHSAKISEAGIAAYYRAKINPYINEQQAGSAGVEAMIGELPGGGFALDRYKLYSGKYAAVARAENNQQFAGIERSSQVRQFQESMAWQGRSDQYGARSQAYENYKVVGLPTADRSTGVGAVAYQEQLRLQPALQGVERAERNHQAALIASAKANERYVQTERAAAYAKNKSTEAAKEAAKLDSGIFASAATDQRRNELLISSSDWAKKAVELEETRHSHLMAKKEADATLPKTDQERREARIALGRANLENWQAREANAAERAQAIGSMSPGARMQNKMYAEQLVTNPELIGYIGDDVVAGARAYAPRTIGKLVENFGKREIASDPNNKKLFPEDYQYQLGETRSEVDAARKGVAEAGVSSERTFAKDEAKVFALEFVREIMESIKSIARAQAKAIVAEGLLGAQRQAQGNPPR